MNTSTAPTHCAKAVRLATLTLAAGAFSLLGTVAMARNGDANDQQPTVTVKAPRVIHRSIGTGGLAVEQLSLTRRVSFADLNLDTAQGRTALHARIRANAKLACQELESRYPTLLWMDDVQSCVQQAMLTWMPLVHAAPEVASD